MKSILVVWNKRKINQQEINDLLLAIELGDFGEIQYVEKSDFLQYIPLYYGFLQEDSIKLVRDLDEAFGLTIWEIVE